MSFLTSIFSSAGQLAKMPADAVKGLASNYVALVFMGGFIFFIANTPADSFANIGSRFAEGDIAGTLEAIVDTCIVFGDNVKENFSPEALSETVQNGLCKVMDFTGEYECKK